MSSYPFVPTSNVFNTADYNILENGLTIETANKLYLSLSGGTISGNLNINGTLSINNSLVDLNAISGITNGAALADKALIIDSSRNIGNINQLSLTGKLVLDQTQSIGFYRNIVTLDVNSYIRPENGNIANLTIYSLRGNGSIKLLANNSGTNPLFLINATSSETPSATNLLTLYGNGNLGIGTNTPAYLLDVAGEINSNTNIQVNRSSNGECFICSNSNVRAAIHCLANSVHIGTTTNHNFNFQSNGTNRLTISNSGNITIADTVSGLQLDLGNTGSGLNIPNLTFRGISFNDTYYTGITTGGAVADKAMVLNIDKDYSGIRNLSITGDFIASTSIASPSITCTTLSASSGITTASLTVNGDANITGNWFANGTQILNNSRQLQNISYLDFSNSSLFYKTIIRKSTIAGSAGIEFYDTQFITPTNQPIINFKTGNNDDPIFFRMCGYLNDNNGTWVANGCPFDINYYGNVSYDSGLRLGCINTTQATNNNANIGLWARNFTIPHFIAQDRFNQAHIKPTSSQLNSQITGYGIVCGENMCMNGGGINAMRGNATVFSMINTTGNTTDRISFTMDHNTQWEMSLGGSSHSTVPNGLYWYNGSYKMVLTQSGRLGLGGSTSPSCTLDVATENSVTTTTNIAINTLSYNIASNSWSNLGGGPVSVNMCGRFRGSIWVQDKLYATSDRRLKTDINPLDFTLEHYKKLNPVSYKWKNDVKSQLGLIAQEVKEVCSECINIVENENMTIEQEGDIQNAQYTVDYNCINMMNVVAIKKLINKVEEQKNIIDNIVTRLQNAGL